jgi:hypothetical protein
MSGATQPSSAADVLPAAKRREERARPGVFGKYKRAREAVPHSITYDALDQEFTRC